MNPLLNKIDNDLRRKIYEKTRDGKVHRKADIKVYKDSEKNKGKNPKEYTENEKEENKRKAKIVVEATKIEESVIVLNAEKEENINKIQNGFYIDVKK